MGKRERRIFTEDVKKEAVRLTETSGRTVMQVADDLGIGLSSLTRWKRQYREADLLAGPHEDTAKELARLPLSRRHHGLVQPQGAGLAAVEHDGCRLLRRRS
ncbi:MAG: transposase [Notoacmeibacter sp.]|nr:transposase [Notoacmeibacter sp.]